MVKKGQHVKAHYKGTLEDGTVFDSSEGKDPIEFTAGTGQMIKGFDDAVLSMEAGESKTVTIPSADAYGPYNPDMTLTVPVGGRVVLRSNDGHVFPAKVTKAEDGEVTFDFNHDLAGKDLTFQITVIEAE